MCVFGNPAAESPEFCGGMNVCKPLFVFSVFLFKPPPIHILKVYERVLHTEKNVYKKAMKRHIFIFPDLGEIKKSCINA